MKLYFSLVIALFSLNAFAGVPAYDCLVKEVSASGNSESKTLILDFAQQKLSEELVTSDGKHTVLVELYFQQIQIVILNETHGILFSAHAGEDAPQLRAFVANVARVTCTRK